MIFNKQFEGVATFIDGFSLLSKKNFIVIAKPPYSKKLEYKWYLFWKSSNEYICPFSFRTSLIVVMPLFNQAGFIGSLKTSLYQRGVVHIKDKSLQTELLNNNFKPFRTSCQKGI